MKRIVTGHDSDGKSVFIKTGEPEHIVSLPGKTYYELWATFPDAHLPVADPYDEPTRKCDSIFPPTGGTRIRIVEWSGENELTADSAASTGATYAKELPGFLERMEGGAIKSGFHASNSVDYGMLLKGKMELELDDGATVMMEPGDIVVQNGTRHAWHPKEFPCRMMWVLIGVESDK